MNIFMTADSFLALSDEEQDAVLYEWLPSDVVLLLLDVLEEFLERVGRDGKRLVAGRGLTDALCSVLADTQEDEEVRKLSVRAIASVLQMVFAKDASAALLRFREVYAGAPVDYPAVVLLVVTVSSAYKAVFGTE